VLVVDFDHEFWSQQLPGEVLAVTPAALAAWHTMRGFTDGQFCLGPAPPRVGGERVLSIRHELF